MLKIENPSPKARAKILEQFKDARKVRVGETLFIGDTPEVKSAIKRGLNKGETIAIYLWSYFYGNCCYCSRKKNPETEGYFVAKNLINAIFLKHET